VPKLDPPVKLSDFDFDLPDDLIAQTPIRPRDAARMLVATPDEFLDKGVTDLPDLLSAGDLMVVNDTRVIPARLTGRRGQMRVDATLHKAVDASRWLAFARPGKRLRVGERVDFADGFGCIVEEKHDGGEFLLAFDRSGPDLLEALHRHGAPPLPPYIKRPDGARTEDSADYQTAFAEKDGAVAAPTASLHFTEALLEALTKRDVRRATVTLHVGAGTFLPVKVDDIADHKMHSEWGEVSAGVVDAIAETRRNGGRVIAIGTTALRILEAASQSRSLQPFQGDTDIFITPGYRFRAIDGLMTNFHLPKSTLFMLVSALMGRERMHATYAHAIQQRYRFFSYGDASLLLPGGLTP
jgi:S-adenosylmethionine:tRNA ribosyltransferase-isomerase